MWSFKQANWGASDKKPVEEKKNKEKDNVVGFISELESGLFIPVRIEVATPIGKIISRLHMPSLIVTER